MSKIDQEVQQACDILVYNYLVENGHLKTAELLKEERKNFYTLESKKNEKISEILPLLITEYVELDTVSNNLIYDYLKNHENPKIQKLATVSGFIVSHKAKGRVNVHVPNIHLTTLRIE